MMWIPVAAFAVWVVIWRVRFSIMENVTGLLGLCLIVFAVSVFALHPNWNDLLHQATAPVIPEHESSATYWYFAVALFGAAMTPYEVFFFSSGAVEEHWTRKDLGTSRRNVMIGFPLGGILSIAIASCAAIVLLPNQIEVTSLSQTVMPVVAAGGKLALAFVIVGIVAATFGAALETTLSGGYILAQFLGWTWGKFRRPAEAARFHVVMFVTIVVGAAILFTGVDPILVTEYSVVFSAIALPLTYLPILIVANDAQYMGDETNGKVMNTLALGVPRHHPGRVAVGHPADDRDRSGPMNDELPVKRHRGRLVDARLHLLDRQLLNEHDDPVGIVDDLELSGVELDQKVAEGSQAPQVTALLSGRVVATRILGGAPPRSRLREIPWKLVGSLGVVVKVKQTHETFDVDWMERWLRDHIIRHIPGGRHAAE